MAQTIFPDMLGGAYNDIYSDTYEPDGADTHNPADVRAATGAQNVAAQALASALQVHNPTRLAILSVVPDPTVTRAQFLSTVYNPAVVDFVGVTNETFTAGIVYIHEVIQTFDANHLAAATTVRNPAVLTVGAIDSSDNEAGAFYRHRSNTVLALIWGFDKSMHTGFWETELWEKATDNFIFANNDTVKASLDSVVASAWAANQTADLATLRTALHAALNTAGFLQPDGTPLS